MYPIYALWAHPRSMSTAIERIMRERGDLDCAHEPFMYDYYVHRKTAQMPHFDVDPTHPQTYDDIRDMLMTRAERGPVFFKDMSYYVMPHILRDADFMACLRNIFLIRAPHAAIASYYRIDPNFSSEEAGIKSQWRHYQGLVQAHPDRPPPVVIRAEDVRANPRAVMGAMWQAVGLPPCDQAFDWQGSQAPDDWAQVGGWHGAVMQSQGITPPGQATEAREHAGFHKACANAPHLKGYLQAHLPAYEQLTAVALTS